MPPSFRCAILVFWVTAGFGQLNNLATTADGEQLYFQTLLGLKDSTIFPHEKILRWSAAQGFEIFMQRPNEGRLDTGLSNPYHLTRPEVSGDGRAISFLATRDCFVSISRIGCTIPNPPQTTILGDGQETTIDAKLQLNPDGRLALRYPSSSGDAFTVVDLQTNTSAPLPAELDVADRQALTTDGQVVFVSHGVIHLWSPQEDKQWQILTEAASSATRAVVSADGSVIAFTVLSFSSSLSQMYSLNTTTGNVTRLAETATQPRLSNDGAFVLYLGSPDPGTGPLQMFLTRSDASERWQITSYPEGIREATISGDGRIVYAVTNSNRLLRYRVETGEVQELAPRFPYLFNDFGLGVPGSIITIFGSGLADEAAEASYPLPTSLNGVSAEVAGVPLRIQKVGRDQIRAQIPVDLPAADTTLRVAGPETPFAQSPARFFVVDFQPGWLTGLNGFARHDDLTRPVTYTDPARPGEIVHLDLTGLGATLPPLPSGVPAPAVGVIRVARTIQGRLRDSRQEVIDLEVVAAILIPGTIGSYRVSLRIPEANKLTPDGAGFVLGTMELVSPGAPGRFVTDFGAVAIRL